MTQIPQPNLPNQSMPWGRDITRKTLNNEEAISRLEQAQASENRAFAGQMGAVGRQIQELGSRVTRTYDLATLTVTSNSSTSFSSGTRSLTIPGEGSSGRHALIAVSAPAQTSGSTIGPFVTVRFDDRVVFRDTVGGSTGGLVPDDWGSSLTTSFSQVVPASGGVLSIQMQVSIFSGSSGSASLINPAVSVYFTDRP